MMGGKKRRQCPPKALAQPSLYPCCSRSIKARGKLAHHWRAMRDTLCSCLQCPKGQTSFLHFSTFFSCRFSQGVLKTLLLEAACLCSLQQSQRGSREERRFSVTLFLLSPGCSDSRGAELHGRCALLLHDDGKCFPVRLLPASSRDFFWWRSLLPSATEFLKRAR